MHFTVQAAAFTVDTILEGILHFRVQDAGEQLALGHMLPHVLAQQHKVRATVLGTCHNADRAVC